MTSQTGYTKLNSAVATFQTKSPERIEGNLEKLSHDFFVKKWQVRRFELDIPKKTLKYFVGDELKDEYYELSKIENVDAVSRDRPHRFVVFGKSKKSDNDNVSELHINSDSELAKKQWMEAIKQSISGGTQIDVESIRNIVVVERDTEWTSTDIEIEKIGGHSYLVLYLENLNLFSQLLGIYSTYLLLIHLMPDSTEGPTSCGDTFFIYENPVTGICVGTEVCLIVVAIHLIIDVVFASIISNTIDFQKKAMDFEVDIESIYSSDNFGEGNMGAYILSQLALYMLVYVALLITGPLIDVMLSFLSLLPSWGQGLLNTSLSLSSALFDGIMALPSTISNGIVSFPLVNGVVNPEAFRGMLLSTFGILPWITEGLSRCLGQLGPSTFCGYLLLTEALNACVYLIVPFDEMNQSTLLVLNAISAGAAGVARYYNSLKITDQDYIALYAVPNVIFLLVTTLPGPWYTICMSYLWLATIARVLLSEIFGIFPTQNDIPGQAVVYGFPVVGAIALINFLLFTCDIYNGFMSLPTLYSTIFNRVVNPEAFRGMLLSTFGILPWISEGLSRCWDQWQIGDSTFFGYLLLTEALNACVYLIVPFDEMNQSTLLVLNTISAGAAGAGACYYKSLKIRDFYFSSIYVVPNVVFLLVTTLPGPWYTICMSYLWLAVIARVLLSEIFGIFPTAPDNDIPGQAASVGCLAIGAIALINFLLFTCDIYNGIMTYSAIFNGIVNPEAFRGMLLSTFGILPWITEGLSRCLGQLGPSTFCGYLLLTEALNACVYLIVPFDEMNQSTLLVLNAISAGAAGVARYYNSLKITDLDCIYIYVVPNVVFLLVTTLPGPWYTICMSYLWLATIARVLLSEIFGIFPTQNDIPGQAVVFGFLAIGAIAFIYFIYDNFSWFMFSNDASSSTSRRLLSDVNEANNPPSSSEIFYDTCYLGLSMVFALSTLVTLCRLTVLNRSKVLSATWWEGFHLCGPIVAAFLFVAFSMNWTITEYLEPYNNVFTLVVCAIVYFMTPILIHAVFLPVFNCTINSFVIMLNPMGYLEPNETPLERFVANSPDDQNILEKDSVAFWVTLNMCNFFFENVTEAIICGCLLFSGYNDIFLTLFAIPTILNTSVRLFKVLIPILIYTVFPFLWDCLVAFIDFIRFCLLAIMDFVQTFIIDHIVNCFSFVLSSRRVSVGERQNLEMTRTYDGNDNNNTRFKVIIDHIEVKNASQTDSFSNDLYCTVISLGFTFRTETKKNCGTSATWDIKENNVHEVSLENRDKVKCTVEVWDENLTRSNILIGRANIDIKPLFQNPGSVVKFPFKVSNAAGAHSAEIVMSMEARR